MRRATAIITAYNQEPYIKQAVQSAIDQVVVGGYQVVVIDDCSTDGTGAILQQLADERPRRFRLIRAPLNECTNRRLAGLIREIDSDYIALLDGDDYWTSTTKIQRQVDFLEAHADTSMCFHDARVVYQDGGRLSHLYMPSDYPARTQIIDLLRANVIAGCAPLMRTRALRVLPSWYERSPFGDWPLYLIAAVHGDIGYLNDVLGVYRVHTSGLWSGMPPRERIDCVIAFLKEMNGNLGYAYDDVIQEVLSCWWLNAGAEAELDGDSAGAAACRTEASLHRHARGPLIPGADAAAGAHGRP